MSSIFTFYFDGSLWVGLYEIHNEDGTVQAAKQVFGAEPSDAQLWEWFVQHGEGLIDRAHQASPLLLEGPGLQVSKSSRNPKRQARLISKEMAKPVRSTAAQEALSRAREAAGIHVKHLKALHRQQEADEKYLLRVKKRKEKHRGH